MQIAYSTLLTVQQLLAFTNTITSAPSKSLSFQLIDPLHDVLKDFGGDGFLYVSVFRGVAGGAVLEEVVEGWVFLDEVFLSTGKQALDGGEVLGRDDLAVAVAVEGEDGTTGVADVIRRVVVNEPPQPWVARQGGVIA